MVSLSYSTLKVLGSVECRASLCGRGKRKHTAIQRPPYDGLMRGSGDRVSKNTGWPLDGFHTVVKEIDKFQVNIKTCPCEGKVGEGLNREDALTLISQ